MKSNRPVIVIVCFSVLLTALGLLLFSNDQVRAQSRSVTPPADADVGRFQIATYTAEGRGGCFVIDTATGQMWHSTGTGVSNVVPKLP